MPDDREHRTESSVSCADSMKLSFSETWCARHLAYHPHSVNTINWSKRWLQGGLRSSVGNFSKTLKKNNWNTSTICKTFRGYLNFPFSFFLSFLVKDEGWGGFPLQRLWVTYPSVKTIWSSIYTPLKFLVNILKFCQNLLCICLALNSVYSHCLVYVVRCRVWYLPSQTQINSAIK